jgi:hypothetical protein
MSESKGVFQGFAEHAIETGLAVVKPQTYTGGGSNKPDQERTNDQGSKEKDSR